MLVVFFSNFINHHQKFVADHLYNATNGNYVFVESVQMPVPFRSNGFSDYSQISYVLRAWESDANKNKAMQLALDADIAIFGGPEVLDYEIYRAKKTNKISFDVSERWLKRGWINLFSPRLLRSQWYYYSLFAKKPIYKLCSSAFASSDYRRMMSYKNKCFKWGYFTKVDDIDITASLKRCYTSKLKLMWCSRFIQWKHPELPIMMSNVLKKKGYNFSLDMYGDGVLQQKVKDLACKLNVLDVVNFCGTLPNESILEEMRNHDFFFLTSDRNEGWGAVVNEAMANGCVVVASDEIGSVPYLLKDKVSGCAFKSASMYSGFTKLGLFVDEKSLLSLVDGVEWLINHPIERNEIAVNAYNNIKAIWSPDNAAKNLLKLIDDISFGRESSIEEGPCSKA